jgi:acyl-CoA dehydrogenase
MNLDDLRSPVHFLEQVGLSHDNWLRAYEGWLALEGQGISDAVDRAGTPWLRMYDRLGERVDEISLSRLLADAQTWIPCRRPLAGA